MPGVTARGDSDNSGEPEESNGVSGWLEFANIYITCRLYCKAYAWFCSDRASVTGMKARSAAWAQSSTTWFPIYEWSSSSISCPDQSARDGLAKKAEKGDVGAQETLGSLSLSTCSGELEGSIG